MLGLAHVVQPGAFRPLLPPLDNLDALDVGAVDLVPHFDADAGQVVAQQDGRVDAGAADIYTHAGERVAGLLAHEKDVADVGAVRVLLCEEAGPGAGWVEDGELRGGYGADGVFACLCCRGALWEDGDLLHSVLVIWGTC